MKRGFRTVGGTQLLVILPALSLFPFFSLSSSEYQTSSRLLHVDWFCSLQDLLGAFSSFIEIYRMFFLRKTQRMKSFLSGYLLIITHSEVWMASGEGTRYSIHRF